jgi:N-acetylneuraminic acid mutarotase
MKLFSILFFSIITFFACKKEKDSVPLSIKQINPMTDGPGAVVTIKGTGFGNDLSKTTVTINGVKATISAISDTLISILVPETATTGLIMVSSNSQKASSSSDFLVLSGKWTKMANFPGQGRADLVAFTIGNLAYVGLGFDGGTGLNDMYAYDAVINTWKKKADLPSRLYRATGIATSSKGYVFCGSNTSAPYCKEVWEYDPTLDKWTRKTDFPGNERVGAAGFCINNKIYVGLGRKEEFLKDWWEYDPATDTWKKLKDFPGLGRPYANTMVLGNKPHLGLGAFYSPEGRDWWEYNVSGDTWVQKADFPGDISTSYSSYFTLANKGYIAGGQYNKCWEYDVATNKWTQKTSHPFARIEGVGFSVGSKGYLSCGGGVGAHLAADLWSFDP